MARIAVLSDIHGNLLALRRAVEEICAWSPDQVWFLGDAVVFGPDPAECLDLLWEELRPNVCIQGNTDRFLGESGWRQVLEDPGDESGPRAVARALQFAHEALDAQRHEDLAAFEQDVPVEVEGVVFHLCHGAPRDDEYRLAADEDPAELERRVTGCEAHVVLAGHTHIPWRQRFGTTEVINDGSVGYPFDGDVRGAWLALEVGEGQVLSATWNRFDYDREEMIRRLRALGEEAAEPLVRRIQTGRI